MGFIDSAFKNIRQGQTQFVIWRIENFEVKPVNTSHYGTFYDGDSYIIYSAAQAPGKLPTKNANAKLEYHIHFWLGSKTSTDEAATAAIKTVELDDILNGIATQHREIQEHESNKFKSYFKNGIRILKGGVASGLHHVTDTFIPRLFKIKGIRRPTMIEQPSISWEHFNSGDVFILETRNTIFLWVGKEANNMEKYEGGKVAALLKYEGSKPTNRSIVFIDEDREDSLSGEDLKDFEQYLKLADRKIKPSDQKDSQNEQESFRGTRLYKCTDEDGTINVSHIKDGPLKQSDLNSMDTYIVVHNGSRIWVWVGKKASDEERKKGMTLADEYLKKKSLTKKACVTRVVDGGEPVEFQMLFADWKEHDAVIGFNRPTGAKKTVNMHFDAAKLHETSTLAADTQLVDDGSGQVEVWRLHNNELESVPEEHFGLFFSGDCYLVLYTYDFRGKQKYIIYYWIGSHSSQDERGAIAWHAVRKDEELNGAAVQIRVVQSKEDPQFLMIFKGKMIVFDGGYASSFDGHGGRNIGIPSKFLVQVRGRDEHSTQSVQVELSASSLNTNDVFVLCADKRTYVWCGKGSTGDERERAKTIANEWSPTKECKVLYEEHETEEFWENLGGKKPYANDERLAQTEMSYPSRLFHCSNAAGYFKAEEIIDFSQADLISDDIMILDVGSAIFIWVGVNANKAERLEAPKLVEEYLRTDPRGRDLDCPIITVQQNFEPPNFTGFFGIWDKNLWGRSQEPKSEILIYPDSSINYGNFYKVTKYPLAQLANKRAEQLPEDVNVFHRELHLTDEDFKEAFGITRSEFEILPTWKQNNLKKNVGLF